MIGLRLMVGDIEFCQALARQRKRWPKDQPTWLRSIAVTVGRAKA